MAEVKSGSFNTTGYSNPGWPDYYKFSWELTSQSIADNTSTISWRLTAAGGDTSTRWIYVKEKYVTVNGTTKSNSTIQQTFNGTIPFSGTTTISHNSVGKGSFSASAGGAFYNYGSYNTRGSGSWDLPTIPRYTSITTHSFNSKTETSIKMNWATADTIDVLYYSIDNKSTWKQVDVADGTSGTYTISGLSANTTYNIYLRVRRKDSQLTTDSSSGVSVTTYNYPSLSSVNVSYIPITDGAVNVTFTLSNPSGRNLTCYVKNSNQSGTSFGSGSTTGTSCTVSVDTSKMRNTIGSSLTGTFYCYFTTTLLNGTTNYTNGSKTGTYFTCSQSLENISETSFKIKWQAGVSATSVQFSIDGGGYVTISGATGTGGEYVATGYNANTTHSVKIKIINSYGSSTSASSSSITTYNWPYVKSIGSSTLTIGDSQSFTLYNPLGRTVTLYMKPTNLSTALNLGTTANKTDVSVSKTFSAEQIDNLYQSIPSSKTGSANYYCIYNSQNVSSVSGTYEIKTSECYPVITANNVSYTDLNTDIIALMGDSGQTLIQNKSSLRVTATGATAKNHASISKYSCTIGTTTITCGSGGSGGNADFGVLNYSGAVTALIKVTDSRGLTSSITKTISYIGYLLPSLTRSIERENNYESTITINAIGNISSLRNSSNVEKNKIISITYSYFQKPSGTIISGSFTASDIANGYKILENALDENEEYSFTLAISDMLGTQQYTNITVNRGQPILFACAETLGVGVGCFPESEGLFIKDDMGNNTFENHQLRGYASEAIAGGLKIYYDSANKILYLRNDNSNANPNQ